MERKRKVKTNVSRTRENTRHFFKWFFYVGSYEVLLCGADSLTKYHIVLYPSNTQKNKTKQQLKELGTQGCWCWTKSNCKTFITCCSLKLQHQFITYNARSKFCCLFDINHAERQLHLMYLLCRDNMAHYSLLMCEEREVLTGAAPFLSKKV